MTVAAIALCALSLSAGGGGFVLAAEQESVNQRIEVQAHEEHGVFRLPDGGPFNVDIKATCSDGRQPIRRMDFELRKFNPRTLSEVDNMTFDQLDEERFRAQPAETHRTNGKGLCSIRPLGSGFYSVRMPRQGVPCKDGGKVLVWYVTFTPVTQQQAQKVASNYE